MGWAAFVIGSFNRLNSSLKFFSTETSVGHTKIKICSYDNNVEIMLSYKPSNELCLTISSAQQNIRKLKKIRKLRPSIFVCTMLFTRITFWIRSEHERVLIDLSKLIPSLVSWWKFLCQLLTCRDVC